jgi:hypothetical protein
MSDGTGALDPHDMERGESGEDRRVERSKSDKDRERRSGEAGNGQMGAT